MSIKFGPITQNGYVVPDIEAAMAHWAERLGVGPWFYTGESQFTDMIYRGRPSQMKALYAFANSGDLQIELIEPINDAPSLYREFLDATGGKGGLQHVSSWPDSSAYDQYVEGFKAPGGEILFQGRAGATRFIYFDTGLDFGTIYEMADLAPPTKEFFDMVREAAKAWDGTDPIRRV